MESEKKGNFLLTYSDNVRAIYGYFFQTNYKKKLYRPHLQGKEE